VVLGHEASNSGDWRVLSKTGDLAISFHTVVLQCGKRDGLVRTLDLLWFGENLFLSLLSSSTKTKDQVQGRFLLDVVITQGTSIFQLLTSKDQTLLIWWNTFLILNLSLDIVNGIRRLNIQCDGFP